MNKQQHLEAHQAFLKARLGKGYTELKELWRQCVAGAKKYIQELYKIPAGTRWGSAFSGRNQKAGMIGDNNFTKVVYKTGMVAPRGAIVFFAPTASNSAWHVAIVHTADAVAMEILEQNGGGVGNYAKGDEFTIRKRAYSAWCLGWKIWKGLELLTPEENKIIDACMKANGDMYNATDSQELKDACHAVNNIIRNKYNKA